MNVAAIPMRIMQKLVPNWMWKPEEALAARSGAIHAAGDSPERFEIMAEALRRGHRPPPSPQAMPHLVASLWGIRRSLQSVARNPAQPRTQILPAELSELEAFAHSAGIADIGYATLEDRLIFRDKAVLYRHAIVLTMEMDRARIETSPSEVSYVEVHKTYHHLGRAANRIAGWLRERGYAAQAGHPLMGLALYPPLAQQAGLGWRGMHGLLITPQFGPRVRLAAVFTSIENLPVAQENEHRWIKEYCNMCRTCAQKCPPQAILDQAIERPNGLVTCTVNDRCFPYFIQEYGCSICIRVCPFQRQEYATLKKHIG